MPQIADPQLEQESPARTFAPKLPIFCPPVKFWQNRNFMICGGDKYDV